MSRWTLTRGCKACQTDAQPAKVCRGDTKCPIVEVCPPGSDKAPGANKTCPPVVYEDTSCPAEGLQVQVPAQRPECWCEEPIQYRCVCTDAPGRPACCFGNATRCYPYVCGIGRLITPVAKDTCRTSCYGDQHCVEGYVCLNNECKPEGSTAPPLGGCDADPSICEPYTCLAGTCLKECWTDKHCLGGDQGPKQSGYRCSFPTLTGLPQIPQYQLIGGSDTAGREMPGNLCGSSGTGSDQSTGEAGRCVWVEYDPSNCYDQDSCGTYACGKNNTQVLFSHAVCRTSCGNDAHCNYKAHCDKTGKCVSGAPAAPVSCSTKDYDYCTPYACGRHIALAPTDTAVCRSSCDNDGHCLHFYKCQNYTCVPSEVVVQSYQPTAAIPAECYDNPNRYGAPYKCLRVPVAVNGNPLGRIAFAVAPKAPAPATPVTGKNCTTHATCAPYRCGKKRGVPAKDIDAGSQCQTACEVFDDCAEGFSCYKKLCVPYYALGASCAVDRQCASGHCVDGMCCNSACDLPCQRCTNMGICDWVGVGTDYRNDCGSCMTCLESADPTSPRVCGFQDENSDPKGSCGPNGLCNGGGGCLCHASVEAGYWAGKMCDRCAPGYTGDLCATTTRIAIPPEVSEVAGAPPPLTPKSGVQLESMPIQYASKVIDFTTQAIPQNVQNILGKPDATETYYESDAPNRGAAWEPIQYYCDRKSHRTICPQRLRKRTDWQGELQFIVLEFPEAIYLSKVFIYENTNPGSVVGIWAQPAPTGADASPGGGAPPSVVSEGGKIVAQTQVKKPSKVFDQDKENVTPANSTILAMSNDSLGGTPVNINTNPDSFYEVWSRSEPIFYAKPVSRIYAPTPLTHYTKPVSLQAGGIDVTQVEWKTKVIKLVIQPDNDRLTQIDAVGILGFSVSSLNVSGSCPGRKLVSAEPVGMLVPSTSDPIEREVLCSGNGECEPKGCKCFGNWDGAECANCKFGWTGEYCDGKALVELDGPQLCTVAMFEDLMDFEGSALELRWSIQTYTFRTTRVFLARHFGTKFVSPLITLGSHSHVRVQAGFFIMDMPNHDDTGVVVRAAHTRAANPSADRTPQERVSDGERIVFMKHVPYTTGINIIGTGKGDASDQMDITTQWKSATISIEFEIWSPDIKSKANKGDHRMTLTYFVVHSCLYPSQAGTDSPDKNVN
eukprot:TRINITY_DN31_c1_g1_i1.p1 TRINITY_DN31_c1_g1~~TRINITY_DN31_c1_g1_i1.p1  ORF type:complete len:1171 (+),score=268.90 TRINITY_DN31_c1_g1_i1:126-3638(+)